MTKLKSALASLLVGLFGCANVQAQVTIDVSKITCEQLVLWKVTDPEKIAYWMSGYFNAKRGTTTIDMGSFEQNVNKVKDHCRANYNQTVLQAVEVVLGVSR
jgi:acid stress chaperone HdeB